MKNCPNPAPGGERMLLEHDHSELDELLADSFRNLAAADVPRSFEKLDLFWARLAIHIRAEHLHLFPTLLHSLRSHDQSKKAGSRRPSLETVEKTIARLREDHDFFMTELGVAVKQLRDIRPETHRDKPALIEKVRKKIAAVSERLKTHNELEESNVYPLAETLLTPAECVILNEKMRKELENVPQRFSSAAR
jgi:hemerythrin-like domain-containing protein